MLTEEARVALATARDARLSYDVRGVRAPDGRLVVILGEAHIKLARASALGRSIVEAFELRGVETFQTRRVFAGYALWLLIHVPRLVLRLLSLGLIKGSTITDAKALRSGVTFELESKSRVPIALHVGSLYLAALFFVFWSLLVASVLGLSGGFVRTLLTLNTAFQLHLVALVPAIMLRRFSWSWLLHPAVAILTVRDTMMAEGTVAMLHDNPDAPAAVVVMGRAHSRGYQAELIAQHGFSETDVFERRTS